MTNEEAVKILKQYLDMDSEVKSEYLEAQRMAIKALEQQPKMQDCEHCIYTYGTLGCCDMVNNEWVYDCEFGKEQYKKEHESQPCEDAVSRQAVIDMCKKEIDHISKNWQNYHSPSEAKSGFTYIATNIHDLPSVTPYSESEDKDKLCEYPYNRCINIVKEELNGRG